MTGGITMVDIETEAIFPAPTDTLWKLLAAHQEEATIREIHPAILTDKVVEGGDDILYNGLLFASYSIHQRVATSKRGDWKGVWRVDRAPPHRFRIEILESNGILGKGTYWENVYAEVASGTLIRTKGRLVLPGVPRTKAESLADRILSRIDEEDMRYMRRVNL